MQTRRRRPKTLARIYEDPDGTRHFEEVLPEDHHGSIMIAAPPPPVLIAHMFPPTTGWRIWIHGQEKGLTDLPLNRRLIAAEFNSLPFSRMIAKIALSFAMTVYKMGAFTPLLTDLILEKTENWGEYVGGSPVEPAPTDAGHRIQLNRRFVGEDLYLSALVQLFASLNAPVFAAVVGKFEGAEDKVTLGEN